MIINIEICIACEAIIDGHLPSINSGDWKIYRLICIKPETLFFGTLNMTLLPNELFQFSSNHQPFTEAYNRQSVRFVDVGNNEKHENKNRRTRNRYSVHLFTVAIEPLLLQVVLSH